MAHVARAISRASFALVILAGLARAPLARACATVIISEDVAGIAINYDDATGLCLNVSTDEDSFDAAQVLFVVVADAQIPQPDDDAFAFLGAGAGNPVWVLNEYQTPGLIRLGTDTTSIPFGTFDVFLESDPRINLSGEWIATTLLAVRGPGTFSVWSNGFEGPTVWMTTSHDLSASDAVFDITNSEDRYNFGFSAPGNYEIDLQASAMLNGNLITSEVTTYYFHVEDQ